MHVWVGVCVCACMCECRGYLVCVGVGDLCERVKGSPFSKARTRLEPSHACGKNRQDITASLTVITDCDFLRKQSATHQHA